MSEDSHLLEYESGALGTIGKVLTKSITCDENMFMPLEQLQKLLEPGRMKKKKTTLFSIENPTSIGSVYSL